MGEAFGSEDQVYAPLLSHVYSSAQPQFQEQVLRSVLTNLIIIPLTSSLCPKAPFL